jgi:hypothetical protein
MTHATSIRTTRRLALRRPIGGSSALAAALALAVSAACTGTIGGADNAAGNGAGGSGSGSGAVGADGGVAGAIAGLDSPTSFTCDPTVKPAMDQLRALSTRQYLNTVSDLVATATGSASAGPAVLSDPSVAAALALLPANTPTVPLPLVGATAASAQNATSLGLAFPDGGWLRADQSIQESRVAAFYGVGTAVAQLLTSPAYLGKVVGSCALGANAASDMTCFTSFLTGFGSRALRRPLTADDVTLYTSMYTLNGPDTTNANPAAAAYADVITGLLNAPELLYFVEHGDQPVSGVSGVYTLSAFELASRLSYHVWDTLPDTELWNAAQNGSLLTPSGYQKEVDRLFADPRAAETLDQFFIDYFQTESIGGPRGTGGLNYHFLADPNSLTSPQFIAFAGADKPTTSLYANMVADAIGMARYYSWAAPGTLHDLLSSSLSFAKTPDVAALYGVSPWDGASTPPSLPAAQRPGVFTRALFLAAGIDTSPILKGVYLRRYVLCDTLGTPPAAAANKSVPLTTTETTRQATTALTSGSPCSSCHTSWINPLGFATESFDGLGRFRTQETLYTATGAVATQLPVDTSVTPYVMMGDGTTTAAGADQLMSLVEATGKPAACLARNYFRHTFARFEDVTLDGCSLEAMTKTLSGTGQLADLWKSVTQTTTFKQRSYQ